MTHIYTFCSPIRTYILYLHAWCGTVSYMLALDMIPSDVWLLGGNTCVAGSYKSIVYSANCTLCSAGSYSLAGAGQCTVLIIVFLFAQTERRVIPYWFQNSYVPQVDMALHKDWVVQLVQILSMLVIIHSLGNHLILCTIINLSIPTSLVCVF